MLGDSVFKVLADGKRGLPRVVSQDSMRVFCRGAEDNPSRMPEAHTV